MPAEKPNVYLKQIYAILLTNQRIRSINSVTISCKFYIPPFQKRGRRPITQVQKLYLEAYTTAFMAAAVAWATDSAISIGPVLPPQR